MRYPKRFLVFVLLVFLMIIASACQIRHKGRKPSEDWSRGLPVGLFVKGNIDLVVTPDGTLSHFVWLTEDEEEQARIQYTVLDETAVPQLSLLLDLPADRVRHPRLVLGSDDSVHFLWSTRKENEPGWDLWYGQLDENGVLKGDALQLAPADDGITGYDVVADGNGGLFVVWENSESDTLYGSQISADGTFVQDPIQIASGVYPSLQIDKSNTLHMAWLSEHDMMYAHWPEGQLGTAVPTLITSLPTDSSGKLDGPELGLTDEWAYLFWSHYYSSGLEAGTAVSEYAAFPLAEPQLSTTQRIKNAPYEEVNDAPYQSAYQLTQLAQPASASRSTNFVRDPKPTVGRDGELAVAMTMSQNYRLDSYIQMAVGLFKDGEYLGYQMAGKTEAFSQDPVLVTDDKGYLYLAWRDGGRGSLAYYAVTTEAGQRALNRMEGGDIAAVVLNGGLEVVTGMLFFPLACVWLIPGFLIIGIYHFWKGESSLKEPATIVFLVISIAVSQGMKILLLPTITTYVPFSAWLDIPTSLDRVLIISVPVAMLLISLLFAWLMRKRTESGLAFFFWFTGMDALLTLAVYGVNLMGVF